MAQQIINLIAPDELIPAVTRLKNELYRLTAVSCTGKDGFELIYSFSKESELYNLKVVIPHDREIESISRIYPYSFLYENEIRDLFGARIQNISIDFQGNLYKMSIKTPYYDPPADIAESVKENTDE